LNSDPKLQKCWVNLERINVAEEKKRLKNSLQQTEDEVRPKRMKLSRGKEELEDEDNLAEMPRETKKVIKDFALHKIKSILFYQVKPPKQNVVRVSN
jgi:hypothetical protein